MKKRNLILIILLVVLSISVGFLYLKQEKQGSLNQVTKKEAEQLIKDIPEIQRLLEKYPKYTVEASTDEESGSWLVWVYYLGENKTSTSTWKYFKVNKTTKKITPID